MLGTIPSFCIYLCEDGYADSKLHREMLRAQDGQGDTEGEPSRGCEAFHSLDGGCVTARGEQSRTSGTEKRSDNRPTVNVHLPVSKVRRAFCINVLPSLDVPIPSHTNDELKWATEVNVKHETVTASRKITKTGYFVTCVRERFLK